jgi:anti-anti-sigma regulatory factor
MEFKLAHEAAILSTRYRSSVLTAKIERQLTDSATEELILDFEGVRFVSYSFADEFLSAMIGQARYMGLDGPSLVNLAPAIKGMLAACLSTQQLATLKLTPQALH